jgi:transposase
MPRKELTPKVKGLIVDLIQKGVVVREVARRLKVTKSTVSFVYKKFEEFGSTTNRATSGRPRATTRTDDRAISRMAKKNPKVTAAEINKVLRSSGVTVSNQTVRNRLYAVGLKGRRARCKPLISKKNKKVRLEFARNHIDKPVSFWEKVLWTDETKLNMFQSDGKCTVWRESGKAADPKNTTSSVKHGGGSVMAWACFSAEGTGDLVFIDDLTDDGSHIMNGGTYRKILETYIQKNAR